MGHHKDQNHGDSGEGPRSTSEIVCQVGNRADQVEFIWSTRGGYFRPYVVSGTQLIELRQAAGQTRAALESVVYARSRGADDSGELRPSEYRRMARSDVPEFFHHSHGTSCYITLISVPRVAVQVLRRVGASLDQMLILDECAANNARFADRWPIKLSAGSVSTSPDGP